MNPILISVLCVTGIGVLCAVILAIASKVMSIKTDERLPEIREILPGANCGACGFAGCDGYAAALIEGNVKTNLCTPGGDAAALRLSEKLGLAYEDVIEKVAYVRCGGNSRAAKDMVEYQGIQTCAAATLLHGGQKLCPSACLGFGDCAQACPYGAIRVADGLAQVISARCTGCGLCVTACPKGIIAVVPDEVRIAVACSSHQKGAAVRRACEVGCIACRRCEKECPEGAIRVVDELAVIDYDKCTACGRCVEVCPTHCIHAADFRGASKRQGFV